MILDQQKPFNHLTSMFEVIRPVSIFQGRDSEINRLHYHLIDERNEERAVAVVGLGGVGKTQLVRQYIKVKGDFFDHVVWINARSERYCDEAFRKAHIKYLDSNDDTVAEKSIVIVVRELYDFFVGSKCLFVFNNAQNDAWLEKYFPKTLFIPYIIITSRDKTWPAGVYLMEINELKLDEAKKMVEKGLKLRCQDENIDELVERLCKTLQCLPLALGQAISYINFELNQPNRHQALQSYLTKYEDEYNKRLRMLNYDLGNEFRQDYKLTTLTTWSLTTRQIRHSPRYGRAAIKILIFMAYFEPLQIPSHVFLKVAQTSSSRWTVLKKKTFPMENIDEEVMHGAIGLLVRYSMIGFHDNRFKTLHIHRVVQDAIRIDIQVAGQEKDFLDEAFECFSDYLGNRDMLNHSISLFSYTWKYPEIAAKHCKYLPVISRGLHYAGRIHENNEFVSATLAKIKGLSQSPEIDKAVSGLRFRHGQTLRQLNRLDEALELFFDLVNQNTEVYGEEHEYTRNAERNIAMTLYDKGTLEAVELAQVLFSSIFAISSGLEKNKQYEIFRDLQYHARCLKGLGKYSEAKAEFDEIDRITPDIEISDSKDTQEWLRVKYQQADLVNKMGNFETAISLYHRALEMSRKLKDFKDMFLDLLLRRDFFHLLGQYDPTREAIELLKMTYDKHIEVFGKNHKNTLRTLCMLHDAHRNTYDTGRIRETLECHKNIYQQYLEIYNGSEDHVFVQLTKRSIADDLSYLGDHGKAVSIFGEVLHDLKRLTGTNDAYYIETEFCYVHCLIRRNSVDEAYSILKTLKSRLADEKTDRMEMVTLTMSYLKDKYDYLQ